MSINLSAYDTTACSGFPISKIKEEITKAQLMGGFQVADVKTDPYADSFALNMLEGGNSAADAVGFFKHPVLLSTEVNKHKLAVFLDVRDYGTWSGLEGKFRVRAGGEYVFHIKRAILNNFMIDGRVEALRDISSLPLKAYAALISQSVARRFALDPAEQMTISVLAGFFYLCLFTDESKLTDHELQLTAGKLATDLRMPAQAVFKVLDGIDCLHCLDDLCKEVHLRVGNVALQNFNCGTLLACVAGNWIGNNSREILSVGLEHIPTWLVIVEACLSSQTYRRSTLAKIVQKLDTQNASKNFSRSLDTLLGGSSALTIAGQPVDAYVIHSA